jgi:UDP-GlcNAc:undecaprenyl-phosphate GlcNAc-1-phosphate transferase
MKTYILVYLAAAVLASIITPIVIRIAIWLDAVDEPNVRKVHSKPVPRIGGMAIFISATGLILLMLFLPNEASDSFEAIRLKVITLLVSAAFIFIVGLVDDMKGLRACVKLSAQMLAAIAVCSAGIRVTSVTVTDSLTISLGIWSWPLAVLWIVGITNAINFIDGLDGLAAGICAAACGVIALLTLYSGLAVMTIMMLALMGSLTGFLVFNFNPAKIFMGDSGSLFLGFMIGSSSILCAAKGETLVGLALPFVALGVPVFDILLCILRRLLERRSIFSPDHSHFHHRLMALGLRQRHAVIFVYVVTLLAAGLGMFMTVTRNAQTLVIFTSILILLGLIFRAVGAVRLREIVSGLRQNHAVASQVRQERACFEEVELHFRQVQTFDQWWETVCLAAERMDLSRGLMCVTNRDGSMRKLVWGQNETLVDSDDAVKMTLPISDRRANSSLKLEVEAHANGSLESVSRRLALFGRLIEEYNVAALPSRHAFESALVGLKSTWS